MNKLKWMVTSITMVGLVAFTSTTAFADDGGQGWHSHQGWGYGFGSGSGNGIGGGPANPGLPKLPPGLGNGMAAVSLSAGWNLVDETVASALSNQGVQLYSDYWNGQSYQSSANSAADGMWVYVPMSTMVAIPTSSSGGSVSIGAKSWGMLGNPFAAPVSVTLQAGDVAYTYNATSGHYSQAMTGSLTLSPGQGAWVYSASGGTYTIGMQPPAPPSGGSSVTGSVYGTSS